MSEELSMTSLVSMATADWFMVGVLIISLFIGALRGLVYEVLSVLGWISAFFVAQWLTPDVAALLPFSSATPAIRFAAAFALTFIAAVFVAGLLASLLKKLVAATGLRPADRLLGAFFGLARGLVLLLAATLVINMTQFKISPWWEASLGAPFLSAALKGLKPMLPEQFSSYLN